MTTIESLSPELLLRIIELAGGRADTTTLASASLVARRWKDTAQAQMWRNLDIISPGKALRITRSPVCGELRTEKVTFCVQVMFQLDTVGELLSRFQGVREVELWGASGNGSFYDGDWINAPSLTGAYSEARCRRRSGVSQGGGGGGAAS